MRIFENMLRSHDRCKPLSLKSGWTRARPAQ